MSESRYPGILIRVTRPDGISVVLHIPKEERLQEVLDRAWKEFGQPPSAES